MPATRARSPDGRWHFQHGPIDLILEADGDAMVVQAAHERAWHRFATVLDELVAELPALRQPVRERCPVHGRIARCMWHACAPYRIDFVTPMAAVAGAVADELLADYRRPGIRRAWVNNGGDIALHLAPGTSVDVGLVADLARFDPRPWRGSIAADGRFAVTAAMPVRGIATSGWRGRSFSRGIADSVTVLARTAAEADAAATMIANAVDVDDPRIVRRPASTLKDDSDLGDLPVTADVPALGTEVVRRALQAGLARAEAMRHDGLVVACAMVCQGVFVTTHLRPNAEDRWHGPRFDALTLEAA